MESNGPSVCNKIGLRKFHFTVKLPRHRMGQKEQTLHWCNYVDLIINDLVFSFAVIVGFKSGYILDNSCKIKM